MAALGRKPRRWLLAALAWAMIAEFAAWPAFASPSLEYAVKAGYLYKFAPFVEWPPRVFAEPSTPLSICVAGEDPFGDALDDAVRGQTVNGRPVVVHRMAVVEPGSACQVLFISRSAGRSLADALKAVAGEPVLTVTESGRSGEVGIIQFVMEEGHVRFDIDEAAARASGLNISSKLLNLAISHRKAGA
jgi:YfiR/HmsC-like